MGRGWVPAVKAQTNAFAKSKARSLRRDATDCERLSWKRLRGEQPGFKFRRQHPFEQYILDFVCIERRLVIEVDGSQHDDRVAHDRRRTKALERAGFLVLRFDNLQAINEMGGVLQRIFDALHAPTVEARHPSPP